MTIARAFAVVAVAAALAAPGAASAPSGDGLYLLTGRVLECTPTCRTAKNRYVLWLWYGQAAEEVIHTGRGRYSARIAPGTYKLLVLRRGADGRAYGHPLRRSRPAYMPVDQQGPWRVDVRVYLGR